MEISKSLVNAMEELGLDENQKVEVINKLKDVYQANSVPVKGRDREFLINDLRKEMNSKADWRKKALIAAKIASLNFDEE